ncbi:universal stress protein [Halorientalis halophila]|uniref:universal stress protein n=1 Tax=Halorientalis halophila TaxID=3108499 RepID=UPI00300BDD01
MYHVLLATEDHPSALVETITDLPSGAEDVEVTVLNVFEEFEVHDEGQSVSSEDLYEEERVPDGVTEAVDALEAAGITARIRHEHGDPATVILETARDLDVDAIAVHGRKRSPVGKALFGSVTQAVLLDADRPVFVATGDD